MAVERVSGGGEIDPQVEEQAKLDAVLDRIQKMRNHLVAIPRYFTEDTSEPQTADEVAQATVERLRDDQMDALQRATSEPYFGRVDLQETGEHSPMKLYIGKRGIEDIESGDRMVVDWRAPVASVFYSFSGQGLASYEAPDGTIEADVRLKRNIAVRAGALLRVVDSYVQGQDNLPVTDEFLLYRLADNKDSRLRDIVSTIQAEQDKIIRADRNLGIVIQGVAGSGKTTVALHRLAYLLYQHAGRMRSDRMVIFAPNAMFVDYISEVLPELGVGGIRQTTFTKWALQILDNQVVARDGSERMARWFATGLPAQSEDEFCVAEHKGTRVFQVDIDRQLRQLEQTLVPSGSFEAWPGMVLDELTIRNWFEEEYKHYPIATRRNRVLARVKRWLDTMYRDAKADDQNASKKKLSGQRYRAYAKKWATTEPYGIYQTVLSENSVGWGRTVPASDAKLQDKRSQAKAHAGRPVVDSEDLAPLLYIHARLNGVDGAERFDHVVIDEAQDFSPLQLAVLREYCPSGSFTILGDLSQSIHSYQGISNWSEFLDQFTAGTSEFFRLDVSYRSTMEIIEFANTIIGAFGQFTLAQPVFRSGDLVSVQTFAGAERTARIVRTVQELAAHANTIAVVTRTEDACAPVHAALQAAGIDAYQIDATQQSYSGGISVLPVYLTKGLEFDAVVLLDVDARQYPHSELSAKLLYVGCTRALHRLVVLTNESPSPLLATAMESCRD